MKVAVLALAALAAAGCGGGHAPTSGPVVSVSPTALMIWITANKQGRLTKVWTLTCPDKGTLPQARQACTRLEAMKKPFAPVPKGIACTLIYGGPQIAEVTGRFRGHAVSTRFTRSNGCEIARWDRVGFLFPSG